MVRVCLLAAALCLVRRGVSQEDCFPPDWLKSVSLSVKISKAGFHRDVEYSVRWSSAGRDVRAVLVQKLPSGVYMDEYELEALRRSSGPEVLLDARPDLEAPEYLSPGFTALVFLSGPRRVEVPVHGRYQRPSGSGGRVTVELERPRLLLRSDQCRTLSAEARLLEVRAPCTAFKHQHLLLDRGPAPRG
ncbi:phosphatidylinositol-glycan biosynthesis class X protein isoform X2 [Puntigrus tetrazona]|uniref:phosphatidylinositol-glycan biosynthesis class X protein isoform X2 n=1 Tax=Puntigrus tetrazona TaxID=1606681 RepID=UPI001C89E3E8|nr:phosphatidylinositol-glycan biosynthesis class X protein isoform X2 [Puntigrus tetrazona]